jgi:hypothetical protein
MRQALILSCLLTLAGCGGKDEASSEPAQAPPPSLPAELTSLYDYDSSAPFDVQEVKSEQKDGATVHDLSYVGPKGRITAFLVVPDGDGPFPAVLFMPGAPGARFTFYSEAIDLAKRGIVSLLPDPPYARPPIEDVVEFKPSDKDGIVQEIVEMRRGIDFLVSRDEVDPSRLGYVGFSWGASLGPTSRRSSGGSARSSSCRHSAAQRGHARAGRRAGRRRRPGRLRGGDEADRRRRLPAARCAHRVVPSVRERGHPTQPAARP